MIKLITMLVGAIPAFISGVLMMFTRKWAVLTASLTIFAAITLAFVVLINGFLATLSSGMVIPTDISDFVGMFIPSNFALCLATLVSAKIARGAYDLAVEKTRMFNTAG